MELDLEKRMTAVKAELLAADRTPQPPASPGDIQDAADYLRSTFDVPLPSSARTIWQAANGIDFNGLSWYRPRSPGGGVESRPFIDDIISVNETFLDTAQKKLVHFGESDMDAYVLDVESNTYHAIDKVGHTAFESFTTFEAMFCFVVDKYLAMWRNEPLPNAGDYSNYPLGQACVSR